MKVKPLNTLTTFYTLLVLLYLPVLSYANSNAPVGAIVLDSITQVQPRCGLDNGSITVYAHGTENIFYSIDNGLEFQEENTFTSLGLGDYSIIITDGLACVQQYTVQLTNGPQVEVDDVIVTCNEQNVSADINVDVVNGIPPFFYEWSGPDSYSSTAEDLTDVPPGEYLVTITDNVGCQVLDTVEVSVCCGLSLGLNLYCPDDLYLECGAANNDKQIEDWLDSALGFDGQNRPLEVTNNLNLNQGAFCEDIVTVRFFTIDECGNQTDCAANILIADINIPTINCPPDVTIDFEPGQNLNNIEAWIAEASASDNCTGAFVTHNFDANNFSIDCNASSSYEIEFVAQDQCSNSDLCSASITIRPAAEVILFCSDDLELECSEDDLNGLIEEWIASTQAADVNGNVLPVTNDFEFQTTYQCGDEFEINFMATDYCNNALHCNAKIRIVDTQAPLIDCDNHFEISAFANDKVERIEEWLASIDATDNCSETETTHNFEISSLNYSCGVADNVVVKFESEDQCGNKEICLLNINIVADQIDLLIPEPLELNCDVNNQIQLQSWLNEAKARNQFGEEFDLENNLDASEINCADPTQIIFSYVDNCGESYEGSSSVILIDNEPPIINCPDEFSIMSFELPSFDFDAWLEDFTADDVCSQVMISNDFNYASFDGSCKERQVVHFQAQDLCGNISECSIQVRIADFALPEIQCPDDLYMDTSNPFAQEDLDTHFEKIISNTNSTLSFEFSEEINFDRLDLIYQSKEIEVVVTATNECDEFEECSFMIFINSDAQIFAPTVFSPNGDGENDRFSLYGNSHLVKIIELSIFDRLGNRVEFLTNVPINHPSQGWDGTIQGRAAEIGVYSYYARIVDLNGREIEYFGSITLLR